MGGIEEQAIERLRAQANRVGREMPTCLRCGKSKYPVGRSIPMEVGGGVYCTAKAWEDEIDGCADYRNDPKPDDLYPGEETMFEFVKGEDLRALLAEFDRVHEKWQASLPTFDDIRGVFSDG